MIPFKEPPAFGNYLIKEDVHLVLPPSIDWALTGPGFLILYALLFFLAVFWGHRVIKRWRKNAYRRAAIHAFKRTGNQTEDALHLLRETAVQGFPGQGVPGLWGTSWWDFLNRQTPSPLFTTEMASRISDRYRKGVGEDPVINAAVLKWIQSHKGGHHDQF